MKRAGRYLKLTVLTVIFVVSFMLGRISAKKAPVAFTDTPAVREAAEVNRSLGRLEARLLQADQWVALNAELQRRHEHVSALTCAASKEQTRDAERLRREKAVRRRLMTEREADDSGREVSPASTLAGRSVAKGPVVPQ